MTFLIVFLQFPYMSLCEMEKNLGRHHFLPKIHDQNSFGCLVEVNLLQFSIQALKAVALDKNYVLIPPLLLSFPKKTTKTYVPQVIHNMENRGNLQSHTSTAVVPIQLRKRQKQNSLQCIGFPPKRILQISMYSVSYYK